MITHKSDLIFVLAEKYQIPLDRNKQSEFLDETYDLFCQEYLENTKERDTKLKEYLVTTSNLFRTFLPWEQQIFHTIFQLQWYYDELIIYDPIIIQILHSKEDDKEVKKEMLRNIISYLSFFKDSIDFGFLLFCGHESLSMEVKNKPSFQFENLINIPEIRDELDKLVYVAKLEKYSEEELVDFTIKSYYRVDMAFTQSSKNLKSQKQREAYRVGLSI